MTSAEPILAAGAVLWRREPGGGVTVALVHRPRYDDWSLPKGKLEPGEPRTLAALREVAEETGFNAALGRHLAITSYRSADRPKLVNYWAAHAHSGEFAVNSEVDQLRWLPVSDALTQLSYSYDAQVLERFAALPPDTSTVLVVRHAKAGSRKRFQGDDRLRPLDEEGARQAAALVALLQAFGADQVHAADRTRCVQTVQPLAEVLGTTVVIEPTLSDDAFADAPQHARRRLDEIAAAGGTPVLCSQGAAIPALMGWLAQRDEVRLPPSHNRKASTWVLSRHGGRVVAIDHLDAPFR